MTKRIAVNDEGGVFRADISSRTDIEALVETFYSRAFVDNLIGPLFVDVAQMDLSAHLPVIADFWEVTLLRTGSYRRNALRPHVELHEKSPITPEHLLRWLDIWSSTVDNLHSGPRAEFAKEQARRIAYSMGRRLHGESAGDFITIERPDLPPGFTARNVDHTSP